MLNDATFNDSDDDDDALFCFRFRRVVLFRSSRQCKKMTYIYNELKTTSIELAS